VVDQILKLNQRALSPLWEDLLKYGYLGDILVIFRAFCMVFWKTALVNTILNSGNKKKCICNHHQIFIHPIPTALFERVIYDACYESISHSFHLSCTVSFREASALLTTLSSIITAFEITSHQMVATQTFLKRLTP
jgi:hypothetical protein